MNPMSSAKQRHLTRQAHETTGARMAGFSVIELMVAIGITAALLLGIVQVFNSAKASYSVQTGLARAQESARYATSFMQRHLREAGYYPFAQTTNPNINMGWTLLPSQVPAPVSSLLSSEGGGTASDSITVNYFSERDCFDQLNANTMTIAIPGIPATTAPNLWHKQVTFSHDAVNNRLIYTCAYGQPTPAGTPPVQINAQPMIDGVYTLQFLYGPDIDNDGSPNHYVDANTVPAAGGFAAVVSVQIGLITGMTQPVSTLPVDANPINLFGTNFPATNLNLIRRGVITTVQLRNLTI